jgi:hypothetical protein
MDDGTKFRGVRRTLGNRTVSAAEYDVRIQIWNKDTNSVRSTVVSCTDQTATAGDVRCFASGIAEQTIASNEVVRVRIAHSSGSGIVSIDYDDADTSGDSRATIPTSIPEFQDIVLPVLATVVVPVVWRWSRRRRSRRGRGIVS